VTTLIPKTRAEAHQSGATRYFTGNPCPHGHVCDRLTANATCVDCQNLKNGRRYAENQAYRERTLVARAIAYEANPQKFINLSRQQYMEDPEPTKMRARAQDANRRAAAWGLPGVLTAADVRLILAKPCPCGAPSNDIAHKIPFSWGGPNTVENIQGLCEPCHVQKTNLERQP